MPDSSASNIFLFMVSWSIFSLRAFIILHSVACVFSSFIAFMRSRSSVLVSREYALFALLELACWTYLVYPNEIVIMVNRTTW